MQNGVGSNPLNDTTSAKSNRTIFGYFFYGVGCSYCDKVKPYLSEIQTRYPDLNIEMLEVYHNTTNQEKFSKMNNLFGIKDPGVPTIFIGNRVLLGYEEIKNHLEEITLEQQRVFILESQNGTPTNASQAGNCPGTATSLTIPLIVVCALIASINPCAFAVLIFLLLSIMTLESRKRVLMVGGTYILAAFLFYLLSGIGLMSVVQVSGASGIISSIAAILAIILGIISIIDVMRNGDGFLLGIPPSKKPALDHYIHNATLPAAFILGVLVGIFALPCTGGIYFVILSRVSSSSTFLEGLPYLLLYNLIFILPLVIILFIIAFGIPPERVNSWRIENRRILRVIIGAAMIAIGVFLLAGGIVS